MTNPFLLSRILLRFDSELSDLLSNLSAVTTTPDGSLWLGSDELKTIERLSPLQPHMFGKHRSFAINDYIPLPNPANEIDIEGMDYANHYLWLTGSHSPKRGKPKGKNPEKDVNRLAEVEIERNRYLIARIPVVNGELFQSCPHPKHADQTLTAACLQLTQKGNLLMDALKDDDHLGTYVAMSLPSKENGFDIEGLAVHKNTIFLGLRGPVLRGFAMILEITVAEAEPGTLSLKAIAAKKCPYKKHFLDLDGLGIRELCFAGKDLIILAGPTMKLEGAMRLFRWKNALHQSDDSLSYQTSDGLEKLADLPFTIGSDHAEGFTSFPYMEQENALLVVYDSPHPQRHIAPDLVLADIFLL